VARTGVAVAALMVAVSVTIGVTTMIASFRATVTEWLALALRADIYVGGATAGAGSAPTLDPSLRARVAAVPGVAAVESLRVVEVDSPRGPIQVAVTDASSARDERLYRVARGAAGDAWARVQAGAVLASEPLAARLGLPEQGGRVVLETDHGPRAFDVAGVYYDYSTERGTLLMARATYDAAFDDRALTSLALDVRPGSDPSEVAEAVRAELGESALQVTLNASLRRTALRIFDRTFAVTQALRVLAVVVAFIGVWSALMALHVERTREFATLSALGLLPGQLWRLAWIESGLLGLVAGLLSWPTGALLAAILVEVINVRSFGWTLGLRFEPRVFVEALAVSVSAALLAAVYPLRRLQRLPVATALRQE
jgi:putative ABC transport system permease protein